MFNQKQSSGMQMLMAVPSSPHLASCSVSELLGEQNNSQNMKGFHIDESEPTRALPPFF